MAEIRQLNHFEDKRKTRKNGLPEKQFAVRNSLLIDLFENDHIRTVYHMFLATFVALFVNTVVHDYLKNGEITLGLRLIVTGFGKFHLALLGWLGFFTLALGAYLCFNVWAGHRPHILTLAGVRRWDRFWVWALAAYYASSFLLATLWVSYFKLPPASSAVVVNEQTRFLMKVHAFVREKAPKVLEQKPHDDTQAAPTKFSAFLYFLFAPTLVYRDEYPRTDRVRWNFVFFRFLEVVGVIFYLSFVFDRFLNPSVSDFGDRKFTVSEMVLAVFENTVTGILILLPSFFLILHSWQNLFAEVMRFGDRMFYKDWWTCTSLSGYFRTWNVVVHDWLYAYVYKDMCENVVPKRKLLAKFTVFLVSAVVHEWILTCMFGFFFPLLFVEFFCGVILNFVNPPKIPLLNVLFLYSLGIGMGSLVSMYAIEYYARRKAPIENPSIRDYFVPRFLTCNCIEFK